MSIRIWQTPLHGNASLVRNILCLHIIRAIEEEKEGLENIDIDEI